MKKHSIFILEDEKRSYMVLADALDKMAFILPQDINSFDKLYNNYLQNLEPNEEKYNKIFREIYENFIKSHLNCIKVFIIDIILQQNDNTEYGIHFIKYLINELSIDGYDYKNFLILVYSQNATKNNEITNLTKSSELIKFVDKSNSNDDMDTILYNIKSYFNDIDNIQPTYIQKGFINAIISHFKDIISNINDLISNIINIISVKQGSVKEAINKLTIKTFGILILLTILAMIRFFITSLHHLLTDNSESSLLQFVETVFVLSIPLFIFHAFLNFYLVSLKPMLVDSGYSEKSIIQSKKQLQLTKTLFISSILSSIIIKLVEYISISAHHTAGNNTHPTNNIANDKFANKVFELIQEIPLNYYYFIGLILIIALILMFYLLTLHTFEHQEEKKNNTEN